MSTSSDVPLPGPEIRPPVACSGIPESGEPGLRPGRKSAAAFQALRIPSFQTVLIIKLIGFARMDRRPFQTVLMPSTMLPKKSPTACSAVLRALNEGSMTFTRTHSMPVPRASQAGLMTEFQIIWKKSPTAWSAALSASQQGRMIVSYTVRMPLPRASQAGLMTLFQIIWKNDPTAWSASLSASQQGRITVS